MESIAETKLAEVVSVNRSLIQKGLDVAAALTEARKRKIFDTDGDMLLQDALNHGKEIDRRAKWWEDFISPVVKTAHAAWKATVLKRDEIKTPLDEAKNTIALAAGAYRVEREEARRLEEDRLRKQREKEEEDRIIAEAATLEKNGATEEAAAVLEQPVMTAPVVLPSAPKVEDTSFRQNWKHRVVDPAKVPREYCMPDEVMIGQMVRAKKGQIEIPGVEIYAEHKAAFSSR
jgi:hypothetical protein